MSELKIKGFKGQLNAIEEYLGEHLTLEELVDACDCIATVRTYLALVNKKLKDKN